MGSLWRSVGSPRRFLNDESGATAIEYGLIASLVFLVLALGVGNYGDQLRTLYATLSTKVVAVLTGA
ncbi:MAG: Flp family type IVb pilin [Methylobacterium sp.]|uniref:Flp family type IVb pilin n=1 Tax=Methylobacterium sp. TaxID=409 RepID=UPI00258F498D|nr:Flp family type IVb pilin [Methylobacterium sp.]MBY0294692.1 Flp family type IVb pilin [Methylobacterium sp.]